MTRRLIMTVALLLVAAACGPATTELTTTTAAPNVPTAPSTTTSPSTAPPADDALPFLGAYAFEPSILEVLSLRQPSRIEAVVGLPVGDGPFPVAVFIHGVGYACTSGVDLSSGDFVTTPWSPPCTRPGSDYLRPGFAGTAIVDQLARQGVAGVSIDANAAYVWWGGEVPEAAVLAELVRVHLGILAQVADGTIQLEGLDRTVELDFDRVGLVGHSRGGAFVEGQLAPHDAFPDQVAPAMSAAVLIGTAPDFSTLATSVPLLNFRSTCDADIGPDAGRSTAEIVAGLGTSTVVDVLVTGASHWAMTSYPLGRATEDCEGLVTDASTTADQVAQLTAAFLSAVLNGEDPRLPVDPDLVDVEVISGRAFVEPILEAPSRSPSEVPLTELDKQLLTPILPEDRFLDEERLDDF